MLDVINTVLIAAIVLVVMYFILNIKDEISVFKGIYNDEQDDKHQKIGQTVGQLSSNDEQLKKKADEHNTKLDSHAGRLTANETKLGDHETRLTSNKRLLNEHQDLLRNRDTQAIQDILTNNPDVAESDVYSLIGHNNKLINDNYTTVFNMLEKDTSNNTIIKSENGEVKINVTNPSKLKVCDPNGQNCTQLITRRFMDNIPQLSLPDDIEAFEADERIRRKLNEWGQFCDVNDNNEAINCKKVLLYGELERGPQGEPGPSFNPETLSETDITNLKNTIFDESSMTNIKNNIFTDLSQNNVTNLKESILDDLTILVNNLDAKVYALEQTNIQQDETNTEQNNRLNTLEGFSNTSLVEKFEAIDGVVTLKNKLEEAIQKLGDAEKTLNETNQGAQDLAKATLTLASTTQKEISDLNVKLDKLQNSCIKDGQEFNLKQHNGWGVKKHHNFIHGHKHGNGSQSRLGSAFTRYRTKFSIVPFKHKIRVVSIGYSVPNTQQENRSIWVNDKKVMNNKTLNRSYNLLVLDYNNGEVLYKKTYDIYSKGISQAKLLNDDLTKYDKDNNILIINTYDEPQKNRKHIKKLWDYNEHKMTTSKFHKIYRRGAYVLIYQNDIGIIKEIVKGEKDNDPDAIIDLTINV